MSVYSLNTKSGGLIELFFVNDRFLGPQLVLHVDQSTNLATTDDDCKIVIDDGEIKDLIALLNGYLTFKNNGTPYVVLAENIIDPAVKIEVDYQEFAKNNNIDIEDINKILDGKNTNL